VAQRQERRRLHQVFANIDPVTRPYLVLVYTDQSRTGIRIQHDADPFHPPSLAFGLLIHPQNSARIALRALEYKNLVHSESGRRGEYTFLRVGDGTDQATRNIIVSGGRLYDPDQSVLLSATPFFPMAIFFGKESLISLVSELLNRVTHEYLATILQLSPKNQELKWNGTIYDVADSKWLWLWLNVKGSGEACCYLCNLHREQYGQELSHPDFDAEFTLHLGCRYITTMHVSAKSANFGS
jgi:hypothetical protein